MATYVRTAFVSVEADDEAEAEEKFALVESSLDKGYDVDVFGASIVLEPGDMFVDD